MELGLYKEIKKNDREFVYGVILYFFFEIDKFLKNRIVTHL